MRRACGSMRPARSGSFRGAFARCSPCPRLPGPFPSTTAFSDAVRSSRGPVSSRSGSPRCSRHYSPLGSVPVGPSAVRRVVVAANACIPSLWDRRFAAADARPYAFALRVLLGSTLASPSGCRRAFGDAVAYVGLTALTLYLHYLSHCAHPPGGLAYGEVRQKGLAHWWSSSQRQRLGVLLIPAIPTSSERRQGAGRRCRVHLRFYKRVLAWVVRP